MIYCAPGNGGTASMPQVKNVDISTDNFAALSKFCQEHKIDLVVVGPDNPLADGIVDVLEKDGLRVFGPRRESARLEWSKAFAKKFMTRFGLPTSRYEICESEQEAIQVVKQHEWARVIKVDGLALGKGVFVCDNQEEAVAALSLIFQQKSFGDAGNKVVIEEKLGGPEVSLLTLCDGRKIVPLLPCRDHKRRFDQDRGPNTGGMGVYGPVSLTENLKQQIQQSIIEPLEKALRSGEFFYKGVLYIGLMLSAESADRPSFPHVLEFNARFGDPETQALLPLMTSDLLAALWACTESNLENTPITWSNQASCCVVAVSKNYPESSAKGDLINIDAPGEGSVIFQAGTKMQDGKLITNGGRILAITSTAPDLEQARVKAYQDLKSVSFNNMEYRSDIAQRATVTCPSG